MFSKCISINILIRILDFEGAQISHPKSKSIYEYTESVSFMREIRWVIFTVKLPV